MGANKKHVETKALWTRDMGGHRSRRASFVLNTTFQTNPNDRQKTERDNQRPSTH